MLLFFISILFNSVFAASFNNNFTDREKDSIKQASHKIGAIFYPDDKVRLNWKEYFLNGSSATHSKDTILQVVGGVEFCPYFKNNCEMVSLPIGCIQLENLERDDHFWAIPSLNVIPPGEYELKFFYFDFEAEIIFEYSFIIFITAFNIIVPPAITLDDDKQASISVRIRNPSSRIYAQVNFLLMRWALRNAPQEGGEGINKKVLMNYGMHTVDIIPKTEEIDFEFKMLIDINKLLTEKDSEGYSFSQSSSDPFYILAFCAEDYSDWTLLKFDYISDLSIGFPLSYSKPFIVAKVKNSLKDSYKVPQSKGFYSHPNSNTVHNSNAIVYFILKDAHSITANHHLRFSRMYHTPNKHAIKRPERLKTVTYQKNNLLSVLVPPFTSGQYNIKIPFIKESKEYWTSIVTNLVSSTVLYPKPKEIITLGEQFSFVLKLNFSPKNYSNIVLDHIRFELAIPNAMHLVDNKFINSHHKIITSGTLIDINTLGTTSLLVDNDQILGFNLTIDNSFIPLYLQGQSIFVLRLIVNLHEISSIPDSEFLKGEIGPPEALNMILAESPEFILKNREENTLRPETFQFPNHNRSYKTIPVLYLPLSYFHNKKTPSTNIGNNIRKRPKAPTKYSLTTIPKKCNNLTDKDLADLQKQENRKVRSLSHEVHRALYDEYKTCGFPIYIPRPSRPIYYSTPFNPDWSNQINVQLMTKDELINFLNDWTKFRPSVTVLQERDINKGIIKDVLKFYNKK